MIGVNPLRTKVLITTDEVMFHAPTDHEMDPRIVLQSIVIAERRFIKPMLCATAYDALVTAKNKLVTEANKDDLQTELNEGRGYDREGTALKVGDYVNSDTYLNTTYQLPLWNNYLHKLTAECVYFISLPVNRARFTSKGVVKNYPESIASTQESATIDLKDLKHLMDRALQDRIEPMMNDMHDYLCKVKYPGYERDCGCDRNGTAYKKNTGVLFGLYNDEDNSKGRW